MGQAHLDGLCLMYIYNNISISTGAIIKKFAATSRKKILFIFCKFFHKFLPPLNYFLGYAPVITDCIYFLLRSFNQIAFCLDKVPNGSNQDPRKN